MSKKVTFTPKPTSSPSLNADTWVAGAAKTDEPLPGKTASPAEKIKRFTFDVPESLHRRVKARCAEKGVDMADEMRRLLEQRFSKP